MDFTVISPITRIEMVAVHVSIRERKRLIAKYGGKRWRKMKGFATVELFTGQVRHAELHWYEAHGVGSRKMKIKRFLD